MIWRIVAARWLDKVSNYFDELLNVVWDHFLIGREVTAEGFDVVC